MEESFQNPSIPWPKAKMMKKIKLVHNNIQAAGKKLDKNKLSLVLPNSVLISHSGTESLHNTSYLSS